MPLRQDRVSRQLEPWGLLIHGILDYGDISLVLVGNAGSGMWEVFTESPEYADGKAHPLDRWTRRIGAELANACDARVIFPFDGPPYAPFLQWAENSGAIFPSPVSMYIHPHYGLWHAFRLALVFSESPDGMAEATGISPCLDCRDQPCLSACPVDAFDGQAYRVDLCVDYLSSDCDSACRNTGCIARHACPVGREFTYQADHARFHMDAFLRAQNAGPAE